MPLAFDDDAADKTTNYKRILRHFQASPSLYWKQKPMPQDLKVQTKTVSCTFQNHLPHYGDERTDELVLDTSLCCARILACFPDLACALPVWTLIKHVNIACLNTVGTPCPCPDITIPVLLWGFASHPVFQGPDRKPIKWLGHLRERAKTSSHRRLLSMAGLAAPLPLHMHFKCLPATYDVQNRYSSTLSTLVLCP